MVRVSGTICETITVSSTVSHVPQLPQELDAPQELTAPLTPQPEPHELAPHGLQLSAQGAEQQELTWLPQQPPAWADAVIKTAAASDRT